MDEVKAASLAPQRFLMALLAGLAAAAVLLAAIGIHGLIATSVTERTREMGIHIALGASPARTVRTAALPGIVLALAGITIGIAGALALVDTVRAFVWGVSPSDPATFAGVAGLLLAVATLASVLPALRLLRLDPTQALRQD
jgi:ABC-type antimicrobial peptide transport system permease subunit